MKVKYYIFVPALLLFSCNFGTNEYRANMQETVETEITEQEKKPVYYSLTLIAAGDNLFHETIINSSFENGIYDFTPIYSEVKSIVENSNLAFINQETVMAGESFGYSGYPAFNTPQPLAQALADTGFDIVNQANNHAMDMGRSGLYATLDLWESIDGITVIGARRTGENHYIITENNITLGFLSYTYGLNGNPLPQDNPNLVSLINRNKMAQEIDALRPLCDFLIVSMHWGEEYFLEPDPFQKNLALFFAEHNVDLIIGHHPHVLQRFEKLPRPDGKETFCFYSLGNFVSHQRGKERILGAMMTVTFTKEEPELLPEKLSISNSGLIPVVCHFESGFTNTKVYPLYAYTQELLEKHYLRRVDSDMNFDFFKTVLNGLGTKMIMHNPMIN